MFKSQIQNPKRFFGSICSIGIYFVVLVVFVVLGFTRQGLAQEPDELEFSLDATSATVPLPKIFNPGIDLSGRGFHRDALWPQNLAAKEALEKWKKEIGFSGLYRLQYNLWEISQLYRDRLLQEKLLDNYESVIKEISDNGGTVILNIFGTPAGLGKVLDKKSPPLDARAFKELVKRHMRRLSCDKRYNIWYEAWSAPDLDDFFLGSQQEYLNLYRLLAEAAKELSAETKIHIPVGGPASSWWFQNVDGNTPFTPEKSLIYNLIKFCYRYRLPLDFISWHAYSTDPSAEKELSAYNKYAVALIREWLSYFDFNRDTPLVVTEWNYDFGANILAQRQEHSYIAASYTAARIKNMQEAGLDYQLYFCLEDFKNNREGVIRNTGVFTFDSASFERNGASKATYNAFLMLARLKSGLLAPAVKINDEFVGIVPTQDKDANIALLVYNYIDPEISRSYLADNISALNGAERKSLLNILRSGKWDKIIEQKSGFARLGLTQRVRAILKKAQELYERGQKFQSSPRSVNIVFKNLKGAYSYQRYALDSSCSLDCVFSPAEEKEISAQESYKESLSLPPYSLNLIILKKKMQAALPEAPAADPSAIERQPDSSGAPK